jgi:hypothetical protein
MAADKLSFQSARPIDIAQELLAYQKYSSGAGDAFRDVGTTLDDFLKSKSARDTAAFNLKAAGLPTAEARNAAYEQAISGFNLLDPAAVQKSLRATEVHDWAGEQREEQAAQAADLLLTQKGEREDRIADNLRQAERNKDLALNAANKLKQLNEKMMLEDEDRDKDRERAVESDKQAAINAVNENARIVERNMDLRDAAAITAEMNRLKYEREADRWKEGEVDRELLTATRELELETKEATEEERQRKQANKELVRDQHAVVQSVLDNPALDRLGKPEGGPEAAFKNLEDIIQENINNEVEQASLIDRYQRYLEDNVLTTITQEDINIAFPTTKKIAYTAAGRKRIESAIYKRLRKQYTVNIPTIAATLKTMATGAVSQSPEHADKFDKPLLAAHKKMQAAKKGDETSTYVAERDYLVANHTAEDVAAFDKEHRSKALRDITIDLTITSKSPTPRIYDTQLFKILGLDPKAITEKNKGRPVLDAEERQIMDFLPIVSKQPGDINQTDLDNLDMHVFNRIQELHNIPNLTDVESQKIGKRSQDKYAGLGRRLSRAQRTIAATAGVFDITQQAEAKIVTAKITAKAEARATEATIRANIEESGNINKEIVPIVLEYFKKNVATETWADTGQLHKPSLSNDVGKIKKAIQERSKISKADIGVIIRNFLISSGNTTIDTWGYNEILVDTDADGVGDTEINKIGKDKLFRLAMAQAAEDDPKFEDVVLNFDIKDLRQKIKGNNNQLKQLKSGAKLGGFSQAILLKKLNDELTTWNTQLTEKTARLTKLAGK